MAQPKIQTSFAAGELSPTLYARVDLAKYHVGAAFLRNFYVDYRGGVSNRPGTIFVGQCRRGNSTVRPIPFQFSTLQNYVLEFSDLAMRVILSGAYVTDAAQNITGISIANPGVITIVGHGYSTNDWVYLSRISGSVGGLLNGQTVEIVVLTPDTFSIRNTITQVDISTIGFAYTSGGTAARIYTLTTPYTADQLSTLRYAQNADLMTLTHAAHAPRDLVRLAHNNWTLTQVDFRAEPAAPANIVLDPSGTGNSIYGYVVTTVDREGNESASSLPASIGSAVDITTTTGGHIAISWDAVSGADSYNVYKTNQIKDPASSGLFGGNSPPLGITYGLMTSTQGVAAVDTNIAPDFAKTPPILKDPFTPGQIDLLTITNVGSGYTSEPTVSITGGGGSGASARAVVVNGTVGTLVILDRGSGYTSAPSVGFSGGGGSGATATATIGPLTGTYPGVVAYFKQRKVYAATLNQPATFWMSQPGKYNNFNLSDPTRDDDSIEGSLVSLQLNAVKHLVPMPGGLIAFTSYGAWQISGGGPNNAVTPSQIQADAQASNGVSDIPPLVIDYNILYVSASGPTVRDFKYSFETNIYSGTDITVLSNHLFVGNRVTGWTYAESPWKIVWTCMIDGQALALTYLREQDVIAWTHHDTAGLFMDCCTITDITDDIVYFVVKRYIQGIPVQYMERLSTRLIKQDIEYSNFLDSGLSTPLNTPNATITAEAASGANRIVVASAAVFSAGDVGKILRMGGGIGTIVAFDSTTQIRVTWTRPINLVVPNTAIPFPAIAGSWWILPLVNTVGGLWHLAGQTVGVFADGVDQGNRTVSASGTVPVSPAASQVLVGLRYGQQFKSLAIDLGEPTVQGKRKTIPALTVRVADSIGFKVGPDFNTLETWKRDVQNFNGTLSYGGLWTGDYRRNIAGGWNVPGQICIQQDDAYPVTILGIIPEIVVGDSR